MQQAQPKIPSWGRRRLRSPRPMTIAARASPFRTPRSPSPRTPSTTRQRWRRTRPRLACSTRSTLSPCLSSTLSLGHCLQFPPPDQAIMDSDDEVDNASRPPAAPCVQGIFKKLFIPQITYFTMELLIYAISINGQWRRCDTSQYFYRAFNLLYHDDEFSSYQATFPSTDVALTRHE
ncbi:uncharacterized protein LOC119286435 [Triticum dicoccoides]|uniref:uncharacterized protein LOC119286435 n=1 Tax=Triticum dicoccoides TaxID=85692 RepID=UPI00188E2429|nr:uncharacterized protein LOC119286435 [Triticum dicoccoides]